MLEINLGAKLSLRTATDHFFTKRLKHSSFRAACYHPHFISFWGTQINYSVLACHERLLWPNDTKAGRLPVKLLVWSVSETGHRANVKIGAWVPSQKLDELEQHIPT